MPDVTNELTNLANGCEASGDKLAASICRDAIEEIGRLREAFRQAIRRPMGVVPAGFEDLDRGCPACNGSGSGDFGATCSTCMGSGGYYE